MPMEDLSDFSGGIDELVYSAYLSSELIVIDTQTVDGLGVFYLTHLVLPMQHHHLVVYLADVYRLLPIISRCRRHSKR